jgi:hypothetical protein
LDVRQTETVKSEPFLPETSASGFQVAVGKLDMYNSPGVDKFPAELVQAGEKKLHSETH